MDIGSVIGAVLGALAMLGGALMAGLGVGDLVGLAPLVIVLGGTAAATLMAFSLEDLSRAIQLAPWVFKNVESNLTPLVEQLVKVASIVRKDGILALESQKASITEPLLLERLSYVTEGVDAGTVQEALGREIAAEAEAHEEAARVWEVAGGYAPAIGILGAVLGLIQVMRSLQDPTQIGAGVAAAFLATIYGLALSQLILLPWGVKIRRKTALLRAHKEVLLAGLVGIQEGISPNALQERLSAFCREETA